MKTNVTFCGFCDAFRDMNRNENFTYEGKKALFEYLEQYEEDCNTEVELDVIALCCEYSEYTNIEEVKENYNDITDIEELRDNTAVIEFDGGIIIQDF